MSEVKECKYCYGSARIHFSKPIHKRDKNNYSVMCKRYKCDNMSSHYETKEKAIEAWNNGDQEFIKVRVR